MTPTSVKAIVLLGAPGAGKGTLAQYLLDNYSVEHFSTGNLLRNEIKRDTDIGKEVKSILGTGGLVGDDIVNRIIASNLNRALQGDKVVLLDGYPRTIDQAKYLDEVCDCVLKSHLRVIEINVDPEIVVSRISGRRVCSKCGATFGPHDLIDRCNRCDGDLITRADDREEVVRNRLQEYNQLTVPVSDYYVGRLFKVSGDCSPGEVAQSVDDVLCGFGMSRLKQ